jgi:anti-sigma factor RsiW
VSRRPHPLTPLLSRWLDGRVTPKEARLVEMRLASDPEAAEAVRRLREASDVLRATSRSEAVPDLADRVLAAGAYRSGEFAAFRRVARRYVAAAVVLLGLGVGGSLWAETRPAPPAALDDPARTYIEEMVFSELGSAPDESPAAGVAGSRERR